MINLQQKQKNGTSWWLQVNTAKPSCMYYLGPFQNPIDARDACPGYIEDLAIEGSQIVDILIKQSQAKTLKFYEDEGL